ncbi:MAG: (d)CMP kinase [Nanoarchaeota archaeon]|nr:(d)CMP kinase [Nanoarchaeota archaeon]MBU1029647.1 (d)CMP kinase [Nanoarchaeota archaeon]MBU1849183.1 (d)CMP kinase [Nanoarchaeota archaeon]
MIISISGNAGSGKSTVGKLLATTLGFKRYYMGQLRRDMAKKRGMTINEYNKLGETDPSTDTEVDEYQTELGNKEDNFVIEGRTSFHFIPHSIKVFLSVSIDEAAKRIFKDLKENTDRNEQVFASVEDLKKSIFEREKSDEKRYLSHYGFSHLDLSKYDLVIDTTNISPEEVVDKIIKFVKREKGNI